MNIPRLKLLTCRYWAFGQCPNINSRNIDHCDYAHFDTGTLVSHLQQPGTCKDWLAGACGRAETCFYEHRHTSVQALYQGVLELSGFALDIADSAAKSGFNTWNHAALYDLIWSVKRVLIRNASPKAKPVPSHPIYPDRYRPSGIGDNTQRKRRRANPLPEVHCPPNGRGSGQVSMLSSKTQNKEVFRMKKEDRGSASIAYRPLVQTVDAEGEGSPANTSTKRRKLDEPITKTTLKDPSIAQTKHVQCTSVNVTGKLGVCPPDRPRIIVDLTGSDDEMKDVDISGDLSTQQQAFDSKLFNSRQEDIPQMSRAADNDLASTCKDLQTCSRNLDSCRLAMHAHFERFADLYDRDDAMKMLATLATHINCAEKESEQALVGMKRLISWLEAASSASATV